jgi:CheY-like chemotaxis protein
MAEKKRILIIDDDEYVRETICEVVSGFNYDVTEASSGAQALQRLKEGRMPDLVITDIIMPGKSGLEIIAEIRKNFPAVRIIAISGGGGSKAGDILALAQELGSDRVISKPIDIAELRKALTELAG